MTRISLTFIDLASANNVAMQKSQMHVAKKLRKQVRRGKRFAREIWWGDTLTRKRETIERPC